MIKHSWDPQPCDGLARWRCGVAWTIGTAPATRAHEPPSRPMVDSPELATLGPYAVGVRTLTLVEHDAVDVVASHQDRHLVVDLWYPARAVAGCAGRRPTSASLQSEPSEATPPPVSFTIPGIAVRDAPAAPGRYPLVVLSHGRSNATIGLELADRESGFQGLRRGRDPPRGPARAPTRPSRRKCCCDDPSTSPLSPRTLQESLDHEGTDQSASDRA